MGNPRQPVAKAVVSGAAAKNPQRHRDRKQPKVASLGPPPAHLGKSARTAWLMFANEMPWLAASDAALLEIAARVRGELADNAEVGVTKLSMYQSVLSKLGASPTDRSKVIFDDGDESDPEDRFFGRPN